MNFKTFIRESGFKVLAMARLSQCEYSVALYLLNSAAAGLDQLITTEGELATLIGYEEKTLRDALANLGGRGIIRMTYGDWRANAQRPSLSLGIQYDLQKWRLDFGADVTSKDAIVFPFRRQGRAKLQVFEGQKRDRLDDSVAPPTWKRVFDSYVHGRSLDEDEIAQAEDVAKVLVETHPIDQVLLMIRHFGLRIPTLSLLASSWQHYEELFEAETQKVDLLGARQKHLELDDKLRVQAQHALEKNDELSEEELAVLTILTTHPHPRRQLFWAYQLRTRYPKLSGFFEENASLMLAVTSTGVIVKRPHLTD